MDKILSKAGFQLLPRPLEAQTGSLAAAEDGNEEELFERAMRDVVRVTWRHDPVSSLPPSPRPASNGDLEDHKLMGAAMGDREAPIVDHPEYIEGWVGVAGKRYLPRLREGLYSIQGQVDLHGFTRAEARRVVEDFLRGMSRFRSCCVKVIHGRGINSPTGRGILKDSLQRWLATRRMSRHVVAYASAPARDGGVGAVYVLLRQSRR